MLYSQLYRSILRACRDLSRSSHSTTTLAISLPLLISVPSAYGAIVSPQMDSESIQSPVSEPLAPKPTLVDLSTQTIKAVTVSSSMAESTKAQAQAPIKAQTNPANTINTASDKETQPNAAIHSSSQQKSKRDNNQALDNQPLDNKTLDNQALNNQNTASKKDETPTPLIANESKKARKYNAVPESYHARNQRQSPNKPNQNNSEPDVIEEVLRDQALAKPTYTATAAQPVNTSTNTSNNVKQSINQQQDKVITPPNLVADQISQSTATTDTNKTVKQSQSAQTSADTTSNLSDTFKKDSVQKSLERLSEFYQNQAENLRERMEATNVIDANAGSPIAGERIYNRDDASAYRCEGVWVTPSSLGSDSNYQRAIERAQRNDGLSTANGLPLYAQADYGYYDNETYVELSGDVEVVQNGQLVTADALTLDLDTGVAGAKGRVLLAESGQQKDQQPKDLEQLATNGTNGKAGRSGLIAVADELAYNTQDSRATARDVAFASVEMQAHGYAEKLNKPDDTHYELDNVMFSTCPPANRKWQLEAKNIDLNTETGRGEAYNTTFRLGSVPVMYLPYFNFPIDDRRSSGLLTPSARIDSDSGLKLSVPYYLNLAPNYDATLTTDIYTNRNPMLTGEMRYLTENFGEGKLTAAFMPQDKEYNDEDRRGVFYEHRWESQEIPRLTADAVYSYVSDPDYISDFDDYGLVENRLNLPRRAQVNYYNEFVDAQLKVETFQSLKATDVDGNVVQDKDKPYSRLPQLSVDYRLPKLDGPLDNWVITGTHDSAYFKKSINDGSENEKSGVRLFNELSASYPFKESWGYLIPKVSMQHLYAAYDEESRIDQNISEEDKDQSVFVPRFSVDSGLNFYQAGSPFGWFDDSLGGYRLLTPRLKYTYSPYKNQSDIPNFDTRVASYDYDQLFADSWFLGHDRLADSNNIAVGLNYRYIDAMGVTRFDGSIGDQFFLDKPEVTLDTAEDTFDASSTGVAWRSSVQPYRNIWFDFNGALNSDNDLNYISSQVRYRPTPRSLLNFGIIERKEDKVTNQSKLSALTTSAIIPINNNWRVMGHAQYDSRNNKFIDSTLGIDYEDCCYGFSIYGRSYYNDLNLRNEPTRAIMGEFRINGLGSRSSRLSRHLDDKILGFEPVDSLWAQ